VAIGPGFYRHTDSPLRANTFSDRGNIPAEPVKADQSSGCPHKDSVPVSASLWKVSVTLSFSFPPDYEIENRAVLKHQFQNSFHLKMQFRKALA
jgi:hypothetical protein